MSSEHVERHLLQQLQAEVRANQRATDVIDELLSQLLGINRTDARCLDILDEHGRMGAGDLAAASRLTTGAITAVIDRLERAGYVRRVRDRSDRRRVLIEVTPKASDAAYELMVAPMIALGKPIEERYSDDDLRLIIDFTRLGREIQEQHAEWLRRRLRERGPAAATAPSPPPPETRTAS